MSASIAALSPAWSAAGWTMLHFLWVGGLLAAIAALGRYALRHAHPDVRYGYALAILTLLAVTPAVIAIVIGAELPAPRRTSDAPGLPVPSFAPVAPAPHTASANANAPAPPQPQSAIHWARSVAAVLPAVWLLGAPLTFAYLAAGLWGAERLRRQGRLLNEGELAAACDCLARALGVAGRVAVAVCDRVAAPLVVGIVRPLIVLPSAVLAGWSPEQVELALLHELAHVRRCDNLVNLLQRVVESALFFHPAVWWVSAWVRREREHCCDRIVVAHTGRPLDYAGALFLLADATAPLAHASPMGEHHLVDRIRRILNPEDRTMKLSRAALGLAAGALVLPALVGVAALQPTRRASAIETPPAAPAKAAEAPLAAPAKAPQNRQLRKSGPFFNAVRRRDPNAPPWRPGPVPATVSVDVSGVARDETGRVVAGATVILHTITDKGSQAVGKAMTDANGHYTLRGAMLPVTASLNGEPLRNEITPYASFVLSGLAPGFGIAWSHQRSVYALEEPNPDDIQGRLPLGRPVSIDLTFPKRAALAGKVVDETGQPVPNAKLQVLDADLLDADGRETNNRPGYGWESLPQDVGRAVADPQGRFRIDGLPDRACCWVQVTRPETDNTSLAFYAATIDGPDTVHEQLPPQAFNGRGRHDVKTGDITVIFPRIRPITVTVVGDDTGKPIAGARVRTLGESLATGIVSYGNTDAAGKLLLGLPPGEYKGIASDPPPETRYIRTYQRPLVVEPGAGAQAYELRQKAGAEVIFEAVEAGTGKPIADVFFWKAPEEAPTATQEISPSTFRLVRPWTDEKGELRAVLTPEPNRRYRFRFAGIHEPNMPPGINPAMAKTFGYVAEPNESAPVELAPGTSVRLRFVLRKPTPETPEDAR